MLLTPILISSFALQLVGQSGPPAVASATPCVPPQDLPAAPPDVEARLLALERENADLRTSVEGLFSELEANRLGAAASGSALIGATGESHFGLSPSASKIYATDSGISLGGYGEWLYSDFQGRDDDSADALRTVLYVGNRFSDDWLLNTELEFEHGTTDASSGTSDSEGTVSVEFAYLEHLVNEDHAVRGGLLLVPMGLVNEKHEPTTFPTARRSVTESRILPTTWRELGLGALGTEGSLSWKLYIINGLEGEEFTDGGVRDGRQKGNRADFDDPAVVGRLDAEVAAGFDVGVSLYHGNSSQDDLPVDLTTTIFDAHAEWRRGPWFARGLYASALLDDTEQFFALTGESLGDELTGWYVEGGVDVLRLISPEAKQSVTTYARYEDVDTQASLAAGVPASGGFEDQIVTFGASWSPLPALVFKLDYEQFDERGDQWNFLIGYTF